MGWIIYLTGWQQALIATCFTWLCTALGAMLVFFVKEIKNAFAFMMSAAAGIMLASTFFSLLLPALERVGGSSWWVLTLGFLMGALLIVLTDVIIDLLHGFSHNRKWKSSAVMCVAVTMHNIPEGLAIGVAFGAVALENGVGVLAAIMLALGIGIQNFPEGMCVAFPLRANGLSRWKSFMIGQLSGAVEIFAGVIGALAMTVMQDVLPWALSFSAGAMLAVVCSELIPESFTSGKLKATIGVSLGFALMMVLDIAFG